MQKELKGVSLKGIVFEYEYDSDYSTGGYKITPISGFDISTERLPELERVFLKVFHSFLAEHGIGKEDKILSFFNTVDSKIANSLVKKHDIFLDYFGYQREDQMIHGVYTHMIQFACAVLCLEACDCTMSSHEMLENIIDGKCGILSLWNILFDMGEYGGTKAQYFYYFNHFLIQNSEDFPALSALNTLSLVHNYQAWQKSPEERDAMLQKRLSHAHLTPPTEEDLKQGHAVLALQLDPPTPVLEGAYQDKKSQQTFAEKRALFGGMQ